MKTLLLTLSLATAAVSTSHAEIYRPSIVPGTTALGAVAGALIGGHNNDHWVAGAAIGAAAGAIIGTAIDDSRPVVYQEREIRPVAVAPCAPVVGASCTPVVVASSPRVVYVNPEPQVVYVNPCPRPVIVGRPVVYVGPGRYYGRYDHRYDRHDRRW